MNTAALKILEDAISDVGYWCYWVSGDKTFQVEFGGTQLYNEPQQENLSPSGVLALRFIKPKLVVAFVRSEKEGFEWFEKLSKDEIDPFTVSYEEFALVEPSLAEEIISKSKHKKLIVGDDCQSDFSVGSSMAFWSGDVGLAIDAEAMVAFTHDGELNDDLIKDKNSKWWNYWRDYWDKKDTKFPMPEDYACEVTIPIEPETSIEPQNAAEQPATSLQSKSK